MLNQISSPGTALQLKKLDHLQFCKRYLEVHNKASNIACRAELSKFPLIIDINEKILTYSFYSSLMKMTDYYDFYDFNRYSLNDCKIKHYIDLIKKKYISYWRQTLQHSQKLSFYYTIKQHYSQPFCLLRSIKKKPF